MDIYAKKLKEKNLKATPQRLAIFKLLSETKKHPSAETIYHMLEPSHSTMSLATVYKTMDALKNAGLIQAINVGEDHFRFDANTQPHPHIICMACGEVEDLEVDILSALHQSVSEQTDYELSHEQLYFFGRCPACIQKLKQAN